MTPPVLVCFTSIVAQKRGRNGRNEAGEKTVSKDFWDDAALSIDKGRFLWYTEQDEQRGD
jgi:hypothetical protein